MSEIASYTFVPWVRQGIANQIGGQSGQRATIGIELTLSGDKVGGGVETRPPIRGTSRSTVRATWSGLDPKTIIRVEPQQLDHNFEPNYMPAIEFYDEDFPVAVLAGDARRPPPRAVDHARRAGGRASSATAGT